MPKYVFFLYCAVFLLALVKCGHIVTVCTAWNIGEHFTACYILGIEGF